MIQDYRFRPSRWINIHSPWDIISGPLELHDLPGAGGAKRVRNYSDENALIPLAAHLEYWNNPLVFEHIHDALFTAGQDAAAGPPADQGLPLEAAPPLRARR